MRHMSSKILVGFPLLFIGMVFLMNIPNLQEDYAESPSVRTVRKVEMDFEKFLEGNTVLRPFERLASYRLMIPEYKMLFCATPKCMSTMMKMTLCDLYMLERNQTLEDTEDHITCNRRKYPEWADRQVEGFNLIAHLMEVQSRATRINFAIIRHPIERFVSAYGHFCRRDKSCGPTGGTVHTMARTIYYMLRENRRPKGVKVAAYDHMKYHFAPQTWFCHAGEPGHEVTLIRYSYFNKTGNVAQIESLFRKQGVEEKLLQKTLQRMKKSTTFHANRNDEQKKVWMDEIYTNPVTMQWILKMYYHDFEYLGYDFPEVVE